MLVGITLFLEILLLFKFENPFNFLIHSFILESAMVPTGRRGNHGAALAPSAQEDFGLAVGFE